MDATTLYAIAQHGSAADVVGMVDKLGAWAEKVDNTERVSLDPAGPLDVLIGRELLMRAADMCQELAPEKE